MSRADCLYNELAKYSREPMLSDSDKDLAINEVVSRVVEQDFGHIMNRKKWEEHGRRRSVTALGGVCR